MIRKGELLVLLWAWMTPVLFGQVFSGRETVLFDFDWRFTKGAIAGAAQSDFNDKNWKSVNLPHDWSIEDLQNASDEDEKILNLSEGRWKFIRGDNPEYKKYGAFEGNWDIVQVPANWQRYPLPQADPNWGWFRRSVMLSEDDRGKNFSVQLGKIGDTDELYFNGQLVGSSGQMPPDFVSAAKEERIYLIPPSVINYNGRNVLAIRVYSKSGKGGFLKSRPVRQISGPFDSYSEGGRHTAFTVGGVGWYRKTFHVSENEMQRAFRLKFDGVYKDANVWINGHRLKSHYNGYTPFEYNITEWIRPGEENVLAVRVDNSGLNSRWYSGSGIYRHVWLIKSEKLYHDDRYCLIETVKADTAGSILNFSAGIKNNSEDTTLLRWRVEIEDANGDQVMVQEKMVNVFVEGPHAFSMKLNIDDPVLWSPSNPNLYTLRSSLFFGLKPMDGFETRFGIRSIEYSADKGLLMNGKPVLLKGGNIHHDNGALGAKAFNAAEYRKIKLLKEAGYNAVRTVHNPPSSALLNACDELGMMVMEEAFDVWRVSKLPEDYHKVFDENWRSDVSSMVLRDRNHPSVIIWSIGNDIPERYDPGIETMTGLLKEEIHRHDTSRPVTAGFGLGDKEWTRSDNFFSVLDIAGYNYLKNKYQADNKRKPQRIIVGTASYPKQAWEYWQSTVTHPFVIGDFVWSAFDYLGESGIGLYDNSVSPEDIYPATSAYCGDFDLSGDLRPQGVYRKILWSKTPQVALYITNPKPTYGDLTKVDWAWEDVVPLWTWPGYEKLFFEAVVYTNCEEVKLFSNGREIATKQVSPSMKNRVTFLVEYNPGTIVATGINDNETKVTSTIRTAEFPKAIILKPDRNEMVADGQDLVYVDVEIHDKNGNLNPNYTIPLNFKLLGPGEIVGIGNGNPQNTESFQGPVKSTYNGRCQVIIRSKQVAGNIQLNVADVGKLVPGSVAIKSVSSRKWSLW